MGQLEGKVVLLSGGASDIGRATALRLAAEGAAVVVGDVDADGRRVGGRGGRARRAGAPSGSAATCATRSRSPPSSSAPWPSSGASTASTTTRRGATPASTPTPSGSTSASGTACDRDHHPGRPAPGARTPSRSWRQRGGGSIVTISSGTSTIGESTRVAYGVSKAALNQLTRHLAVRYGRDGIRANAIAPGLHPHRDGGGQVPADVQRRLAEANPTRRLGTPDDIARVVVFLCSDAAAYVNGQVLHVDGGHQIAGMM